MAADAVAEFQRRRRRAGLLMTPWMLLSVLGLLLTHWFAEGKDWDELATISFALCGAIGGLIGVSVFRCPKCETVPFDDDGIQLNPARCKKCGARLR